MHHSVHSHLNIHKHQMCAIQRFPRGGRFEELLCTKVRLSFISCVVARSVLDLLSVCYVTLFISIILVGQFSFLFVRFSFVWLGRLGSCGILVQIAFGLLIF